MAFNPLQQRVNEQNPIPAARGISVAQASDQIARLLDDDGRDPGHRDVSSDSTPVRGRSAEQDLDDRQEARAPARREPVADDQDLADEQDEAGDTADAEGGDDTADQSTGDDDRAETSEAEGERITTLQGLAEASEMPLEEFLGALKHTFPAAGGEVTATLQELVSGYKLKADYDRDKTALAQTRHVFEAEQNVRLGAFQQNANVLAQQFNMAEQLLVARLQDPRIQKLREYDQAEFLVQVREVEGQINALRGARQQTSQQYQQYMQGEREAYMQAEGKKLRDEIPDWSDDKLRASVDTIKSLGYDNDEVINVVDSRMIKGALELARLRTENAALRARIEKGVKAATEVKRSVPKGLKPGPVANKTRGPDKQSVSKLKRRLGQTNSLMDAAKVIESMMR